RLLDEAPRRAGLVAELNERGAAVHRGTREDVERLAAGDGGVDQHIERKIEFHAGCTRASGAPPPDRPRLVHRISISSAGIIRFRFDGLAYASQSDRTPQRDREMERKRGGSARQGRPIARNRAAAKAQGLAPAVPF